MGLREFFGNLAATPTVLPYFFRIPDGNIANQAVLSGPFKARQDYFSVRVNEMYLTESRKWFREIEPTVISLTEYSYNQQFISNPFVVGSNLLKSKMKGDGAGFVFKDTRVAGLHPYAGYRFIINLALYAVTTKNNLTGALKFIEKVSVSMNCWAATTSSPSLACGRNSTPARRTIFPPAII
jgi:hypothetical protein